MKRLISWLCWLVVFHLSTLSVYAQGSRDIFQARYQIFEARSRENYKDFLKNANAEYVRFMRESWRRYQGHPAIPAPLEPNPIRPIAVDPKAKPEHVIIPHKSVVPLLELDVPEPVSPFLSLSDVPAGDILDFLFFNTSCQVHIGNKLRFSLETVSEQSVADAWEFNLSTEQGSLISDCLRLREKLNLCDWAYMKLAEQISLNYFGADLNEARLLQAFILTQSGYKIRLGYSEINELEILFAANSLVYAHPYYMLEGEKFYTLYSNQDHLFIMEHSFPCDRVFSMDAATPPLFKMEETISREFKSVAYPQVKISLSVNKNLIDFYNTYPSCEWKAYAKTALSEPIKERLYPMLRREFEGKGDVFCVNVLLNFVQTAFNYMTDEEQFGYERPLFPDETFFYPYSDCEDRAILFSLLVRELLGKKVVLLYYPNHLATAVCLDGNIEGDRVLVDQVPYIICDPTYIGTPIGWAMPEYKEIAAEIIML